MDRYRRSGGRQAPKLCDSRDICVDVASEAWGGISCKFKSQKLEEPWVGAGEPEVMDWKGSSDNEAAITFDL